MMRQFKSHKVVRAGEIKNVVLLNDGSGQARITFADHEKITSLKVDGRVFDRYMAKDGDFFIVYSDGYQSVSPRKEFLEGYVELNENDFVKAEPQK